jgi:hypothetical protein
VELIFIYLFETFAQLFSKLVAYMILGEREPLKSAAIILNGFEKNFQLTYG